MGNSLLAVRGINHKYIVVDEGGVFKHILLATVLLLSIDTTTIRCRQG